MASAPAPLSKIDPGSVPNEVTAVGLLGGEPVVVRREARQAAGIGDVDRAAGVVGVRIRDEVVAHVEKRRGVDEDGGGVARSAVAGCDHEVVLRHYSFADRWFKVNVTTDHRGALIETGDAANRSAFNCDIATPMERDGDETFAVDLFVDVLVGGDLGSVRVGDEDELEKAFDLGLVSAAEYAGRTRRGTTPATRGGAGGSAVAP